MVLINTSNCISVRHMHEYGHKYTPFGGFDPFKLIALLRIDLFFFLLCTIIIFARITLAIQNAED